MKRDFPAFDMSHDQALKAISNNLPKMQRRIRRVQSLKNLLRYLLLTLLGFAIGLIIPTIIYRIFFN